MKYPDLTFGFAEAVVNKLGGMEGAKRFLNGTAEVVIKNLLAPRDTVKLSALVERFDPKEFFQTRAGLFIWDSFTNNVLSEAKAANPAGITTLKPFDLTRNAYDREIKAELPAKHEVELWQIAKLIEGQPNGEDGPLLNNGYANIFYGNGLVVRVSWSADAVRWYVRDWKLDDGDWGAGCRVFSRN